MKDEKLGDTCTVYSEMMKSRQSPVQVGIRTREQQEKIQENVSVRLRKRFKGKFYAPDVPDPRTRAVPDSFPLTASVGDIFEDQEGRRE